MAAFKLEEILDIKKWQILQDSLAQVTNLAIITTDYKGVPITSHSGCSEFCRRIRSDAQLFTRCQKCDSRAGFEAVCHERPYIYLCHYNLIDMAIPITIDQHYVGAVLAGQVKLKGADSEHGLDQILHSPTSLHALDSSEELTTLYDRIPLLSYESITSVANMLFHLCNYIVEEANNKNLILTMYENLLQTGETIVPHPPVSRPDNINKIKTVLSNAFINAYLDSEHPDYSNVSNKLLVPVFQYLYTHKNLTLSLKQAARLCNLSPSYFSRLFTKETGENFTSYTARLKLSWAKQLLHKTDLSITQISDELGFNEPGYFIKIFKKYESVTPLTYRKYAKEGGGNENLE